MVSNIARNTGALYVVPTTPAVADANTVALIPMSSAAGTYIETPAYQGNCLLRGSFAPASGGWANPDGPLPQIGGGWYFTANGLPLHLHHGTDVPGGHGDYGPTCWYSGPTLPGAGAGPVGPAGPAGPVGPAGAPGAPGDSHLWFRTLTVHLGPASPLRQVVTEHDVPARSVLAPESPAPFTNAGSAPADAPSIAVAESATLPGATDRSFQVTLGAAWPAAVAGFDLQIELFGATPS